MSGITGIVYNKTSNNNLDINRMSEAILHRGADDEGYIAVNIQNRNIMELAGKKTKINLPLLSNFDMNIDFYLAHNSLFVFNSSKEGHQPMSNSQKDIWIIFDGEIYNHKTLKSELSEFEYRSNTDTEVLLYAYEKWGINCLQKFNGTWAFVIYDAKKNILFGARDRFGVKPLYYTHTNEFFAFNSEIKGLLAKLEISRKININASNSYLRTGQDFFEGETFFNDIFELNPSHYFIYDLENKTFNIQRYYELPFCNLWEQFDDKKCVDYIEGVENRVFQAVDLRINADVPAGSLLSGGLDSSSVVCSVNKLLKEKKYNSIISTQKVITACYQNSPVDESKWAQYVVDHIHADWIKVFPNKEELVNNLSDLIFTQDVPFGSTSIYAQYYVMKKAKEAGLSVILDGQGGDELFTGYNPYYNAYYSEVKKNHDKKLLKTEQEYIMNTSFGIKNINKLILKNNMISFAQRNLPQDIVFKLISFIKQPESKYMSITGKSYKQYTANSLNQKLYTLMSYTSLPALLRYADRNSMRFSITSRTPFADDIDLIEYVFSIPGVYKIHNGWSKYLLRESMSNIIPLQIKERTDKIGFAAPEYEWLQMIKPYVTDNINSDLNKIIKTTKMIKDWEKIFDRCKKNKANHIWRYINFILWFNLFKVSL